MGLKERHRLHGDTKKHVSARQGLYSRETEGQAAIRRVSIYCNREHMYFTIRKRRFLSQQKFKAEQSFSMGSSVGWAIAQEARKLCGAAGAKRQSWAEHECPSNAGWTATTLAKKIETGTQAKHRRVHAWQITRLCHVRAVVSIFLARVVVFDKAHDQKYVVHYLIQ